MTPSDDRWPEKEWPHCSAVKADGTPCLGPATKASGRQFCPRHTPPPAPPAPEPAPVPGARWPEDFTQCPNHGSYVTSKGCSGCLYVAEEKARIGWKPASVSPRATERRSRRITPLGNLDRTVAARRQHEVDLARQAREAQPLVTRHCAHCRTSFQVENTEAGVRCPQCGRGGQ